MKEAKPEKDIQAKTAKRQSSPGLTVSIIAIAFVVFMFVFIYTGPYKRFKFSDAEVQDLRQKVARLTQDKDAEVARLQSQEALMARLKERKPNFDLWSFMNTLLTETKLKDRANLENYRPHAERKGLQTDKGANEDVTMVQLRLTGVTLNELVEFLYKVYASDNLVVMYRLDYIRPAGDAKGLECNVTFLTPKV